MTASFDLKGEVIMKKFISIITVLIMVFGLSSVAMADKENEIVIEEKAVIAAEDIGIKENEYEIIEEEFINDDSEVETEDMDVPVQDEEKEESNEEVTESPAPPEGKVEGYVAGVYFDPNTVDCEICGGECYTCHDEHTYVHCVSLDDEGYVFEEWCTVCGHGTSKVISDEEFEALGVETNVEF